MSNRIVPAFPLLAEPGDWPVVELLAGTVLLEAEGEPEPGPLAVAFVCMNRHRRWKIPLHTVILGKDQKAWGDGVAYEQFSCWNDDYRIRGRARLDTVSPTAAEIAWRATAGAYWGFLEDPTQDATHYLNIEVTKRIRGGSLPSWFDPSKVTVVIGRHTFLDLG